MNEQIILRVIARLLMPFVLLFGIYVIMHGEISPGGGFQGGVIIAAGFILYSMVFGLTEGQRVLNPRVTEVMFCLGVLLYAGVGVTTMLLGGNFLDYNVLNPTDPAAGQALGITLVEIGVGLTVTGVMVTLFNEIVQ
jgi:multicomponent Na+:H+ antiporter subunit B